MERKGVSKISKMLYRKACSYLYEVSSLYFAKRWTRVGQNMDQRWIKGGQMDKERTGCEKKTDKMNKMWIKCRQKNI